MKRGVIFGIFLLGLLILVNGVFAAPGFSTDQTISYLSEEQVPLFSYNLSANTSSAPTDLPLNFYLRNVSSNLYPSQKGASFYSSWISLNSSTGIILFNSSRDNQTGRFNLTLEVLDKNNQGGGIGTFYFIVNSTNDAPIFTSISNVYNLTADNLFLRYLNASDEERQYPLLFNISFDSCTHAGFSTRDNCSLFNTNFASNTSASISYTPSLNDVGIYYANISVMDAANTSSCNSTSCSPDYFVNKTTYYSQLVIFNVLSSFEVNTSDCTNKIFQQGSSGTCNITVYSKGQNDSLNFSSSGFLRNYNVNVSNRSWFYANTLLNASNFVKTIVVNVTPNKTEVGNWTINFSVRDITYGENAPLSQIPVYVNRTFNSIPDLARVNNKNTSSNLLTNIDITAYDDDLLIPDKNISYGGYNETLTFNVTVLNQSDLGQELSLNNFNPIILTMPVSMTNKTTARISFTPTPAESGNYTINLTVTDLDGAKDSVLFNLSITSNNPPKWNTMITNFLFYEGNNTYLNLSSNISDQDLDPITFSSSSDTTFSSFSIDSSTGIINFTSIDDDVGQHFVTITATDSWGLTNSTILNITILNVDEQPYFRPLDLSNCTTISNNNFSCSEKNFSRLVVWLEDPDFLIPAVQKSFYNEDLTLTANISGPNSALFSFDKDPSYPAAGSENRSRFNASFIPNKNDVGTYYILLNASDANNRSTTLQFNITVNVFEDSPVLADLVNQTTAVSRNLLYSISASDDENGFSNITGGNSNFTFSYSFFSGNDFINSNQSIFNTTTGLLVYDFNRSQGGVYGLTITVNDTTNRQDSHDFWINVYDEPVLNFPSNTSEFALAENTSQNLIFQSNHSVLNNLSYVVMISNWNLNDSVIYNSSYFGNGSNLTIPFTPNFNNETNGVKSLTLIAYPSDNNLLNRNLLNLTQVWNLTIEHTNYPLSNISAAINNISGNPPKSFYLDNFFEDIDASDPLHNQTISFIPNSHTGGCPMAVSIANWTNGTRPFINFSSSTTSSCNFSITGMEYNESNSSQVLSTFESNNFSVDLILEVQVITNTVSTSTVVTKNPSLRVVTPGLIAPVYPYQTVTVPVTIENNGQYNMNTLSVSSSVFKNGVSSDLIDVILDTVAISSIEVNKKKELNLTFFVNTNSTGDYNIVLNVSSNSPKYSNTGNVYFSIGRVNDSEVKKYILFAEEFLTQNKGCSELKEYIKISYDYFNKGNFGDARLKAEEAVNACKNILVAGKESIVYTKPQKNFVIYFAGSILVAFVLGVGYYLIKRHRLKRGDAIKIYED